MAQREWVEKDFYKELGVSSDARTRRDQEGLPQAGLPAAPGPESDDAARRSGSRPCPRPTACCRIRPRRRSTTKPEGCSPTVDSAAGSTAGDGNFGGFGGGFGSDGSEVNLGDLFGAAGQTGGANIGDLFGGLFGRGAQQPRPSRPRRGNDLETETELSFLEATKGVAMPLRLTSPAPCTNCHGSGARPGTSPKVCPNCNGAGVISRNQGAFGFSEPCTECRGSGSIIEEPCEECKGTGVTTRTRTINVRIPPGVEDGQRIRLAGQGEAGLRGAPSGDLYVTVHVRAGQGVRP